MEKKTSQEKDKTESCYIHIPFCKKICAYCDFCKMFYNKKQTSLYLEALEKEIDKYYKGEYQKTLYIGGGTPSSLELNELKNLFKIVKKISYDNNTEFTFECNINDISKELLELLKKNGVNRLSIGIESFNKKVLNILGRESSVSQISKKIDLAKEYFSNINIDLIYGVNGETLEDVKNDLIKFMKLNINHISIYSLILEDNTILKVNGYKK